MSRLSRKTLSLLTLMVVLLNFDSVVSAEKQFESKPVVVKTFENETVLLPCYIDENETKHRVRWYKNGSLLGDSFDAHHLLPAGLRMHSNYSLQIDRLGANHSAEYTCEIVRPEPWGPIRQTHFIKVQYAPTIKTSPEDGFLEVKKGEYVDIGCEAAGSPTPSVSWKKNGEPMALLQHRSRIRFKAEHRMLAGVYECTASNGVGEPVIAVIRVIVHDAPVATAVRSFIHTAVGLRAVLAADLEFATPPARATWYKDGRPVRTDDRIIMLVQENIHELIFRTVRKTDLGNYTFRAENRLGMADVSFKLTGVPNIASFKVEAALNKATATSFTLIWEVDSYSTIIEYNLWLRPYSSRPTSDPESLLITTEHLNRWSKIVIPGDASDGPIHSARYTVRGLTPSTVYEAVVTSRNSFGWSKQSSVLHFATEPGAYRRPSTSDYSETPVLEEIDEDEMINTAPPHVLERTVMAGGSRQNNCQAAILVAILLRFVFF